MEVFLLLECNNGLSAVGLARRLVIRYNGITLETSSWVRARVSWLVRGLRVNALIGWRRYLFEFLFPNPD